jgi:hypothetical protein
MHVNKDLDNSLSKDLQVKEEDKKYFSKDGMEKTHNKCFSTVKW